MVRLKRKLFFAFPWDVVTREIYEPIMAKCRNNYDIYFGPNLKAKNKEQELVETFRNQNKLLYDRFVENIKNADIFIADITTGNANVLMEVGIAIQLNKNILLLSSQVPDRLPFDVRGFDIKVYRTEPELCKKVEE